MTTEAAAAAPPVLEPEKTIPASAPTVQSPTLARATKLATTPSKSASSASVPGPSPTPASGEHSHSPENKKHELPKIVVKKEPTSPEPPSRHRPPRLSLSNGDGLVAGQPPRTTSGALTTMRDVGMACLSPGFATHDPMMREQLQRSISVRDQQRSIIEQRLQRHVKPGDKNNDHGNEPSSARSSRRRPPNSLTIVPPPHRAFAHERVVQSAPLNQSFTGRHHPQPPLHPPPQHAPQPQVNRLPPISDVFAPERLDSSRAGRPVDSTRQYYPPPRPQLSPNNPSYSRPREHRSAEEALASLSGGREDLLPKIIHYGGHQPPTPPSPPQGPAHTPSKLAPNGAQEHAPYSSGRRRTRAEYERDDSYGPEPRDSPETKKRKKEEFLSLCARAWELFHS